ncbi:unnamed protein product [Somion occarium]|uniref:Uncharacterized protein n=1 Tax=Somion occarium TaxID=3059160 RepID=A0ABP1CPY1_9APHY
MAEKMTPAMRSAMIIIPGDSCINVPISASNPVEPLRSSTSLTSAGRYLTLRVTPSLHFDTKMLSHIFAIVGLLGMIQLIVAAPVVHPRFRGSSNISSVDLSGISFQRPPQVRDLASVLEALTEFQRPPELSTRGLSLRTLPENVRRFKGPANIGQGDFTNVHGHSGPGAFEAPNL